MSHLDPTVEKISLADFVRGLSGKHLIVTGFGYRAWTAEDVRLPEAAVRCDYCAVIAIVNSNKSCREAWERTGQERLDPKNYKPDEERAAELLNLPNVSAVIVHDAAGSWQVVAALHEAVENYHPDSDKLAYRAKKPYPQSRGEQMARHLGMQIFSDQINDLRIPVPQNDLPEIPELQFSKYCTIYVLSR